MLEIGIIAVGEILKSALIIFAAVILSGCAHKNILTVNEMGNAFLLPIKFQRQEPDKCGIAALSSVMDYLNIKYSGIHKIYSKEDKGTRLITMVNYSNRYIDTRVERMGYEAMVDNLLQGKPFIIMKKNNSQYHYFVVKGFIITERKIVVNDGYNENVILSIQEDGTGEDAGIAVVFGQAQQSLRQVTPYISREIRKENR